MSANLLDQLEPATTQADQTTRAAGGKFLIFKLAGEEYGIEVLKVREIINVVDITAVPQMPDYVKGVMNLRGRVMPVVALRLKFGFQELEYTEQSCIIVVDAGEGTGIIVDAVSEVLEISSDSIEPAPALAGAAGPAFILGMGKVGDTVKTLLDIDEVMTADELDGVADIGKESGIIVDTVSEVLDVGGDNMEPPPLMEGTVDTPSIRGTGKTGDVAKIPLDTDEVMTTDELGGVVEAATAKCESRSMENMRGSRVVRVTYATARPLGFLTGSVCEGFWDVGRFVRNSSRLLTRFPRAVKRSARDGGCSSRRAEIRAIVIEELARLQDVEGRTTLPELE
jgi:purine-binding chemotaxis protein CheW